MKLKINLPQDELAHENQAIEWWYFNGFLKSKKKRYAYMNCLFRAEKEKANLNFLKIPMKYLYFSHSVLYDLTTKEVKKEILPVVIVSEDSFTKENLFINYFYPIRKTFLNYEIARFSKKLHIKDQHVDLWATEEKKPLFEGGTGLIDLKDKKTYYYTYPRLKVQGRVGNDSVKGISWHDHQWSSKGFMKDAWLWFSFQLPDGTDVICFDYKGQKMATISHPNNKQETLQVSFKPIGSPWKNTESQNEYHLEWEIKIKESVIHTKPFIEDCEVKFGFINYWEGPIKVTVNGKSALGFMEYLKESSEKSPSLKQKIMQTFDLLHNHGSK